MTFLIKRKGIASEWYYELGRDKWTKERLRAVECSTKQEAARIIAARGLGRTAIIVEEQNEDGI